MAAGAYVEFARRAFNRESVYRVQVFTRIGSILLRVFLMATLWTALYRTNGQQAGITLPGMITYVTLALVIGLIYNVDGAYVIREKIREGSIAIDLMRPISVPLYVFADTIGQTLFSVVQIIPALLLSLLIVRIQPPVNLVAAGAFLVSICLGFLLNYFIDLIMATITFWTMEIFGVQIMVQFIVSLLSGALVPLTLFPQGPLQRIVLALPFAGLYNDPISMYIGLISGPAIMQHLAMQVIWVAVFGAFATLLWRIGERRVVVQGG
ncbi:MAG TPA: ABC-2 family transporter protein [Candidatus Eremiobacteraceae bacterium]|nr:ABC-2 family transporter protein [Candidatus Eremiobacteraceae bacterium]